MTEAERWLEERREAERWLEEKRERVAAVAEAKRAVLDMDASERVVIREISRAGRAYPGQWPVSVVRRLESLGMLEFDWCGDPGSDGRLWRPTQLGDFAGQLVAGNYGYQMNLPF